MTDSSLGQTAGIEFTCSTFTPTGNDVTITFGAPDGTFNGKDSWSNGVDSFGTPNYTLRFEADNTWSVREPNNGSRFFFSNVDNNGLPSCDSADWQRDVAANGKFCGGVLVMCTTPPDPDNDGDGFPASTDCDDNNAAVNPNATEVCDGVDNNCDGNIDEGETFTTYYRDFDGDLFGDPNITVSKCDGAPIGYVEDNTDCNDGDAAINPGATEVPYDGVDNDCNAATPDDDLDNDGFLNADDCDDTEPLANPGLEEIPFDTIDNDCDGEIDEDDNPPVVYEYCDDKQKKVLICHNGKTKCVSVNAVDAHLAHGDDLGACGSGREGEVLAERPTSYDLVSWPNPTNDLFNVRMITPNYEDKVNLQAYDINGRLIYTDIINGNKDYQFGSNLQSGIYFVKVTQSENTQVIKVIKQ